MYFIELKENMKEENKINIPANYIKRKLNSKCNC